MVVCPVTVLLSRAALNLTTIVLAQSKVWSVCRCFDVYYLLHFGPAETNRAPFDLAEGSRKSSPASSSNTSAMSFGLFFLGEYANMILMSAMTSILFLAAAGTVSTWRRSPGSRPVRLISRSAIAVRVHLVRASFPRYRYDQLRRLGWKVFLPFSLLWVC